MLKSVEIYTMQELSLYYTEFFEKILCPKDNVLYVGYEKDDILLPIVARNSSNVVAIDREPKIMTPYLNVQYRIMDFGDFEFRESEKFNFIIFSFVLHENVPEFHGQFVRLAKRFSDNIVIIEPLSRSDTDGIEFEKQIKSSFADQNRYKCYYNNAYWKKIADFNDDTDLCLMLNRSKNFDVMPIHTCHDKKLFVSVQDIMVLLIKN